MINKKDLIKKLDSIDLDSKNSQELISILHKSFSIRTLSAKGCSKIVGSFQKEIARTLWVKFPEAAKKEGLKKVRVA